MTRKCHRLCREQDSALLQIHPEDAATLTVKNGDLLRVVSRRGDVNMQADITRQVEPGMVYATFHYHEAPVNRLTVDAHDESSKCPEYKICAVRLEKVPS
jgi:predicted molibdopterin-dependent oxidoreductase YjgC